MIKINNLLTLTKQKGKFLWRTKLLPLGIVLGVNGLDIRPGKKTTVTAGPEKHLPFPYFSEERKRIFV
ncbi:hypothetical protein [Algoriphagus confluentis]|uniref:hypothetical protein n=1 Tax=Algoriphagus confluentis TaxID=1697556 RepID=UPI0030C768B0